jgi:regulator of replication initiation timing
MKNILQALEEELKRRKKSAKFLWDKYDKLDEENKRLKAENESLRADLFNFSTNYFKNKQDGKEEESK